MKQFIVLIMALLFTAIIGCDGDGDSSEVPPPAPGYVPGTGTEEEDDGDGAVRFWMPLLDVGGNVPPGTHFIGGANPPEAGTLRCVYTWSAPPINLTCWLKQYAGGSGESVHIYGPSPLTVTTHVDGGSWSPYVHNAFSIPVYVSVSVDFLPD